MRIQPASFAILILPLLLLALPNCVEKPRQQVVCSEQVRAIIDIGSGSTKMAVAEVRSCPGQNEVVHFLDENTSFDVPLEASKGKTHKISRDAIQQLVMALEKLKTQGLKVAKTAKTQKTIQNVAFGVVGTQALRTASNMAEVRAALAPLKLDLVVLTQEQEALSGFKGVQLKSLELPACNQKTPMIWDVGGGSMQFTVQGQNKNPDQYAGLPLGAESFKQLLIKKIAQSQTRAQDQARAQVRKEKAKNLCAARAESPNPIGARHIKMAEDLASDKASALPPFVTDRDPSTTCTIGIGGVHTKAIAKQILRQWPKIKACACSPSHGQDCKPLASGYTRLQLDCLISDLIDKDDCDPSIKGPYSTTNVSNLLLIRGFMDKLKIESLQTLNVNMGHGLALDHKLVRFESEPIN